jgi:L-rhamnose-H+ transport protein
MNGPLLGVVYHWLGGLAAGSFYIPYKSVRRWSWETYWLVGGVFSWLIAPWVLAGLLVPDLLHTLAHAPPRALGLAALFGVLWGVGGLTFGLSVRYLGVALGVAVALGCCAVVGTLEPPIQEGRLGALLHEPSGRWVLAGVAVCVLGIAVSSAAGISKDRELPAERKAESVKEFDFTKGILVALFCGVMSACFAFGLAAGKPIAELTLQSIHAHGASDLWQNLPVLIVILLGGFCTNFAWCVYLNVKNRTAHQYVNFRPRQAAEIAAAEGMMPSTVAEEVTTPVDYAHGGTSAANADPDPTGPAPLLANYLLSAAAGVTWYLQFFFYSMGTTKMGRFDFSSWTLHMASIILFSTLWGIALKEWSGTSRRTHALVGLGILTLIASTVVIGYGNYVGSHPGH